MLPYVFGLDAQKQLIFVPHLPGLHRAYELRPQDRRIVDLISGCVIAAGIDLGTMIGNVVAGFPVELSGRTNALRLGLWVAFVTLLYALTAWRLARRGTPAAEASCLQARHDRLHVPLTRIMLGIVIMFPVYIGLHILITDG